MIRKICFSATLVAILYVGAWAQSDTRPPRQPTIPINLTITSVTLVNEQACRGPQQGCVDVAWNFSGSIPESELRFQIDARSGTNEVTRTLDGSVRNARLTFRLSNGEQIKSCTVTVKALRFTSTSKAGTTVASDTKRVIF